MSGPTAVSARTVFGIAAFGWCGAASGLVFLLILRWPVQRLRIGAAAVGTSIVAFVIAWIAQDHSCHNPVWYGRGIAPAATFRVSLPFASWRDVVAQTESFGNDAGWSIRRDQMPTATAPWLAISVCRADGTDIEMTGAEETAFELFVYQPQGGDSWQAPMRALHDRLKVRWPDRIDYLDRLGQPTRRPPAWLTRPATPAPSATTR